METKFDTRNIDELVIADFEESAGLLEVEKPAELMIVEQPVNLEELFHELESFTWSLADECREIDEIISMMQEKRAQKEAEYQPKMKKVEDMIRAEILKQGKPFKCDWGSASFRKAYDRTSWDSKKLDGLALVIPQINECKTVTTVEASVSLKVGYKA